MRAEKMGNLDRIATYANWPAATAVSCLSLANSGFVYTGVSDEVTCPLCGLAMSDWQQRNVSPLNEHRLRSPQCPFFSAQSPNSSDSKGLTSDVQALPTTAHVSSMEQSTSNIAEVYRSALERAKRHGVIDSDIQPTGNTVTSRDPEAGIRAAVDRVNPDYLLLREESARLSTFHDWPACDVVQPCDLARAGLYYTGRTDRACCAFCRGVLHNWQPGDDPWVEHRRHFPDCPFVRQQDVGNIPAHASLDQQVAALIVSDITQYTPSDNRSTTATTEAAQSADNRTELFDQEALGTRGSEQQTSPATNSAQQRTTQNTSTTSTLSRL